MKIRKDILISLLVLAALAATVIMMYTLRKGEGPWSDVSVDGKKYHMRVIVFEKPVLVGVGAPPLPSDFQSYLKSFSIISDPIGHSFAETLDVASESMKSRLSEESYARIKNETVPISPQFFQKSVEYLVEIHDIASNNRYLVVAYRSGYKHDAANPAEVMVISPLISENGKWKACGPVPDFKQLQDKMKLSSLVEVTKIVKTKISL